MAVWRPRETTVQRGYARLYIDHVNQASEGADLDFLTGRTPLENEPEIPVSGEPVVDHIAESAAPGA